MDIENSITNHTEFSGSDDTSDSSAAEQHEDSSAAEQHAAKALSPEDAVRNIVCELLALGHKRPQIIQILLVQYDISISPSTLTCKRLNLQEIQARLTKETGITVATCTVKRYLSRLDLRLNGDDLADGKVTLEKVSDPCIPNSAHSTEIGDIIRRVVYELLKGVDPERVTGWLKQTCKQRVFHVRGPNHVWAIDGHDKLKPFGITVYGFIDAWSRKILGLFVHVTNNDPKHIGVYYLKLVLRLGGIPLKVTADYGTETCDVSTYQMMLSHRFGGITLEETTKRMHHTKSTHNQKIECLWSQMMRQHNRSIINHLMDRVNDHSHNMQDPIQKLLFLFLWIPVFQSSANIWVDLNNHARKRKDKTISLPTGCTPDFSYSTPEAFHTVDQLVPVDTEYIQRLLHDNYPNIDDMFTHTPPWFHSIASSIMHDLGSHFAFFPPPSYDVVKIESDDDDDEPNTL
ncbi:hypothetical protein PSTT_05918 [Puccinia striiformis]|uniref:Integrase core domain-containing protein n=1 Tax=Puccinia striiformis TaxID=27350 RepID=A0A2S4VMD0_9BASI|nr:hypothetical protein PSTT_05918 [Puccinia striiformis]